VGAYGSYAQQLRQLMPSGLVWSTEDGTRMGALIDALAAELERGDSRVQTMLSEAHPSRADELLPEYAAIFGCDSTSEACGAAYATRRRQDDAYYQALAAACGFTSGVTITASPAPFSCVSECSAALQTWHDRSALIVDAVVPGEGDIGALVSAFEAAKQLHWIWIWRDVVDWPAMAVTAGVTSATIAWDAEIPTRGVITCTGGYSTRAELAAIDWDPTGLAASYGLEISLSPIVQEIAVSVIGWTGPWYTAQQVATAFEVWADAIEVGGTVSYSDLTAVFDGLAGGLASDILLGGFEEDIELSDWTVPRLRPITFSAP
jgi:uncharacterized protein YmfQ (DUF2313 family)